MKYLISILLSQTIVISILNFSPNCSTKYKINKIDSIKNVYLIYAEKNDSIFKIVSEKCCNPKCDSIRIGETYDIKLISTFPNNYIDYDLDGQIIYGTKVLFENNNNTVWGVFITENLRGLCYIENPE